MAITLPAIQMDTNMNSLSSTLEEVKLSSKSKRKEEEITKIFDSSRRKLDSLDSQRIMGVLDDVIKKTEIVTLLPFIVENLNRYSVMLGSDICNSLQEYEKIRLAYSKACSANRKLRQHSARQRDSTMDKAEKDILEDVQTNMSFFASSMDSTIKTLLRKFKLNPTAMQTIKVEFRERTSEANLMIEQLNQLQHMVFSRLVTSPNEEVEKHKLTVQMMTREKKARTLIKKLEQELNQEKSSKDNLIHAKNETIRKLKSTISMLEQESELGNRKLIQEAQKIEISEMKNSDGKKWKLQQEVIQLKQGLQTQVTNHRDGETTFRKRKYKIETEVENWIQKYDSEMSEKQGEIDELTEIYTDEKKQLNDLEEQFKILEKQHEVIVEERRIAREKSEAIERELRVMIRAATLLQAMWRAYRCRKALKQKQKGKGKKNKGKKKK